MAIPTILTKDGLFQFAVSQMRADMAIIKASKVDPEPEEADEAEEESDEGYCPHCAGSGEGLHSDSICNYCSGSGVERDDSGREDYEADRADQINDERKLAGEWE
jgi:hypothetical protein